MRSISSQKIAQLKPKIEPVPNKTAPTVVVDEVAQAIRDFPHQLFSILKNVPAPVIAPRPNGSWIIDVKRDNQGQMSQMTANFHETTK